MMLLEKLKSALNRQVNAEAKRSGRDSVRKIVMSRSHGNLRLQWGQYYTKKDVDARFARIRKIKFTD